MNGNNIYALILGSSSGFGKATAIELAKKGYNIFGVHLDMGSNKKLALELVEEIKSYGVECIFYNVNAADDSKRQEVIADIKEIFSKKENPRLRVLLHSLAFGAIRPLFDDDYNNMVNKKQIEMTMDVMANSLVYWVQDIFRAKLFAENSRIFALTSVGSERAMSHYGSISAAKAALEAYIRQMAVELAKYKINANAICAGLTDTPASQKIPGFSGMLNHAKEHNPYNRNTQPEDVAHTISMLANEEFYWINGQVIKVDGGESILNFLES